MDLPVSDLKRRIKLINALISGKEVCKLELAIYDIEIDLKEINLWREVAKSTKKSKYINKHAHLPKVTFNNQGNIK